jgi:hypothetical protein
MGIVVVIVVGGEDRGPHPKVLVVVTAAASLARNVATAIVVQNIVDR